MPLFCQNITCDKRINRPQTHCKVRRDELGLERIQSSPGRVARNNALKAKPSNKRRIAKQNARGNAKHSAKYKDQRMERLRAATLLTDEDPPTNEADIQRMAALTMQVFSVPPNIAQACIGMANASSNRTHEACLTKDDWLANGSLSSEQAGHPAINLWQGKNRHDQRLFEKYLILEFQRLHPGIVMKNKNNGGGGVAGLRLKDEHGKWAVDENGRSVCVPDPKGGLVYFVYKLLSPPSPSFLSSSTSSPPPPLLPPLKKRKFDMKSYFSSSSSLLPSSSS
jgi:hypothetical protein